MEFPKIIFDARPRWVALYERAVKLVLEISTAQNTAPDGFRR